MERLSRFRRSRKEGTPTGEGKRSGDMSPGNTTPPPGESPVPQRPGQKLRNFLRPSGKRARSSPPASLPNLQTIAVMAHDGTGDHPATPVLPRKEEPAVAPRIPGFLNLSTQEIDAKFQEIVWLERNRLLQSTSDTSPDFRWARMLGPHLNPLNRYFNIHPWRNNRVKLRVPEGQLDYINASPVVLTPSNPARPPDRYIAMQGPNQRSTDHVWRMVVEQMASPAVIVMLTETHEAAVEKCYQYFPRNVDDPPMEVNRRDEFGDGFRASVRCAAIEDTPAGAAIELRKLIVQVRKRSRAEAGLEHGHNGGPITPPQTEDGDSLMLSPSQVDGERMTLPGGGAEVTSTATTTTTTTDRTDRTGKRLSDQSSSSTSTSTTNAGTADADNNTTAPDDAYVVVEERTVWHFLFKKWPDFGVPALEDLDSFFTLMRLSREKNAGPDNPRIVHCSAGVGRSGTFIALEHLMRELEDGALEHFDDNNTSSLSRPASSPRPPPPPKHSPRGQQQRAAGNGGGGEEVEAAPPDDRSGNGNSYNNYVHDDGGAPRPASEDDLIFDVVNQLREQRRSMVQAESQYLFLYQVMRKLWQDKYGAGEEDEEPAAKRLEVDPFVEE